MLLPPIGWDNPCCVGSHQKRGHLGHFTIKLIRFTTHFDGASQTTKMKLPDSLTSLIVILFVLMLWQMHQQDWGSFLLLLAAEAGLIAVKVTERQKSARL